MPTILLILSVVAVAIAAFVLGHRAGRANQTLAQALGADPVAPVRGGPSIVVNVPPNWTPSIPPMPEMELSGARAHLWYAVYTAALEQSATMDAPMIAANVAVETCFGPHDER